MKYLNFSVVIEEDKNGFFAFCPELQGCYTQGKTYEETLKNIKDAIQLHLKDRTTDKEKLERPKSMAPNRAGIWTRGDFKTSLQAILGGA